jgi:hypothetical protein
MPSAMRPRSRSGASAMTAGFRRAVVLALVLAAACGCDPPATCVVGAHRCLHEVPQVCAAPEGDGRPRWDGDTPCAGGEVCRDGACTPRCPDSCEPGAAACAGDGYWSCAADANGCGTRSVVTRCPEGQTCRAGACVDDCLASGPCRPGPFEVFYVSPLGDDAWSGRLDSPDPSSSDGPLATLDGARLAVRRLKDDGGLTVPVYVLLREGTYPVTTPVRFWPEDSGTAASPITYAAYPGESATVSGGRQLSGWAAGASGWRLGLPGDLAGGGSFGALWIDGERRTRARTPNEGHLLTAGAADPASQAFRFAPGDLAPSANLEDAVVVVYHVWATSLHRIADLDVANGVVTFTGPAQWEFVPEPGAQRYHVENLPEALDQPGEWYLDRRAGVVSYLPYDGEDPATATAVAPVAAQLLVLEGLPETGAFVEHLRFRRLSFEHTDWQPGPEGFSSPQAAVGAPAAIEVTGGRDLLFDRCRIAHTGGHALWWRRGSQEVALTASELVDLGAGGVRVGEEESAPSPAEEVRRVRVDNCFIHDGGKILAEGEGVWIGRSSRNEVTHDEISDFAYTGVSVGWSWGYDPTSASDNLVAHNHIHHLGQGLLSDMGGIYTLGVSPGTLVLHNHVHDVVAHDYGGWGLYADEGSSSIVWIDNLVHNTSHAAFHHHYGASNLVANNILAYGGLSQIRRTRVEAQPSFSFERNIVLYSNGRLLAGQWEDGQYGMSRNLYWDTSGTPVAFGCSTLDEWQAAGRDVESRVADPAFADPAAYDFTLGATSPAVELGFVPFTLDDFGLYGDPAWVDLPRRLRRSPTPPPALAPQTLADDFETSAPGALPAGGVVDSFVSAARIGVAADQSYSGTQSLRLEDDEDLPARHDPYFYYTPDIHQGTVRASFAVRRGPGAILLHEWRCCATWPYRAGPSVLFDEDGSIVASGAALPIRLPVDTWAVVTLRTPLGAGGLYELTVEVSGQDPQVFSGLGDPGAALPTLDWLGFIGLAERHAVVHLDDISVHVE